eukprot:Gb_09274 [translate_table: standard]
MVRWLLPSQVWTCNKISVFHLTTFTSHIHLPSSDVPLADFEKATEIILQKKGRSMFEGLERSRIHWSSELVSKILKRVWDDGGQALRFFNWVGKQKGYKHSPDTYNYMIDILGRMRDYRTLWYLVSKMQREGLSLTNKTFSIIIERYVAAGKADRATRVFLEMQEYGCPPDLSAFNSFLDILCKARKVERAEMIFRDLKYKFRPDGITYNILANGWCLVKKAPMAQKILKQMIDKGFSPTLTTYNTLLNGFFKAGQVNEALKFFEEMKKRGCLPDVVTYTTIIHGLGMAGEVVKAKKIFKGMIKNGCLPNVATYNAMIQVLCKKESVVDAFAIFNEMLKKGYIPNLTTYNVLIRGLCHAKEMDRALRFMNEMKESDCRPDVQTFNIMIGYFCNQGEIEKARNLMKDMGTADCLPNLDTYNILMSALCATRKSNDLVEAGKLLQEMMLSETHGTERPVTLNLTQLRDSGSPHANAMQALSISETLEEVCDSGFPDPTGFSPRRRFFLFQPMFPSSGEALRHSYATNNNMPSMSCFLLSSPCLSLAGEDVHQIEIIFNKRWRVLQSTVIVSNTDPKMPKKEWSRSKSKLALHGMGTLFRRGTMGHERACGSTYRRGYKHRRKMVSVIEGKNKSFMKLFTIIIEEAFAQQTMSRATVSTSDVQKPGQYKYQGYDSATVVDQILFLSNFNYKKYPNQNIPVFTIQAFERKPFQPFECSSPADHGVLLRIADYLFLKLSAMQDSIILNCEPVGYKLGTCHFYACCRPAHHEQQGAWASITLFDVLVESDEGKQSCRRLLAGCNEHSRKPQPDPMAMNSARLPSSFHCTAKYEGPFKCNSVFAALHSRLKDKLWFLQIIFRNPRIVPRSVLEVPSDLKLGHGKRTWPRIIKTEDQSTYNAYLQIPSIDQQSYASSLSHNCADRLILFLQNTKTVPGL